jgi:hypothetical protein
VLCLVNPDRGLGEVPFLSRVVEGAFRRILPQQAHRPGTLDGDEGFELAPDALEGHDEIAYVVAQLVKCPNFFAHGVTSFQSSFVQSGERGIQRGPLCGMLGKRDDRA